MMACAARRQACAVRVDGTVTRRDGVRGVAPVISPDAAELRGTDFCNPFFCLANGVGERMARSHHVLQRR